MRSSVYLRFICSVSKPNRTWAFASGIDLRTLNWVERHFLHHLEFDIVITEAIGEQWLMTFRNLVLERELRLLYLREH